MAFDYNAAIQAGYTPEEINTYLQASQPHQQQAQQGGGLFGMLRGASGALNSVGLGIIPEALGAAYEGSRAFGANVLGKKDMYYNPQTGQEKQDPFLTDQQLGQYSNPASGAMQGAKNIAGAASYAVPFGQGANILTKALIPGAASGALQGMSNPNANPGSVALNAGAGVTGGAIGHGIGALLGKALGVLPKAGQPLANSADALIRGQYNVNPSVSQDLDLPTATQALYNKYGIANKDQAVKIAQQITGQNGILTQIRNNAIKSLPASDLGNINDVVTNALQPATLVTDAAKKNFLQDVRNTLNYSNDGTQIVNSNPVKVMYGISQLENEAHNLMGKTDVAAQQLGKAYKSVASMMEDRLGNGFTNPDNGMVTQGINGNTIKHMLTPDVLEQIYNLNPKLGLDVENNVNSIRDLRHVQAPFVAVSRAAQMAENANRHNVMSPMGMLGAFGLYHLNPLLAGGYLAGRAMINSNASKTGLGVAADKVGNALMQTPQINPLLQSLLSSYGAKGASVTTNAMNQ